MKILSIGNSFSQDAQRYLHALAKADGENFKTVNLYIGGCSLRTHYLNMLGEYASYDLQFNGESTGLKVSIRQVLESDNWDVVTFQQASHFSADYTSYQPYLNALVEYVRKYCPHAKLYIHETWAYEEGSERLKTTAGFDSAEGMLEKIREAYAKAAADVQADGIIPCGEAMLCAVDLGIGKIHRDTFHASLGAGRYLLALCWYKALAGKDVSQNAFDCFDEPVTGEERKIVIEAVNLTFERFGKK